jgi:hypothetical protein
MIISLFDNADLNLNIVSLKNPTSLPPPQQKRCFVTTTGVTTCFTPLPRWLRTVFVSPPSGTLLIEGANNQYAGASHH